MPSARVKSLLACSLLVAAALPLACEDGGDALTGARKGFTVPRPRGDAAVSEAELFAEKLFRALEEDFDKVCGAACHAEGGSGAPTWLKGPDRYYSVKQFPGIITSDPFQSKLLTRGPHAGPDLKGPNQKLGDRVLEWLNAEALALKKKALPGTDPFVVAMGPNSIDVSKGGAGVDGTKINFTAAAAGKLLTLSAMVVVAPGNTAVRVAHPIFVIVPDQGEQRDDPVDSFSNVDQKVAAGQTAPLGVGRLIFTDWVPSNKLRITFTTLEPTQIQASDAGPGGGCKSQATFDSSAAPAIQGTQCLTCHNGQNMPATNALDLRAFATDRATACAQSLSKVNLGNKPQSPIIIHPSGGTSHPFTVPDTTAWRNAMLGWINNE